MCLTCALHLPSFPYRSLVGNQALLESVNYEQFALQYRTFLIIAENCPSKMCPFAFCLIEDLPNDKIIQLQCLLIIKYHPNH